MVISKKLVKELLLPFVLEDSCTEMESELLGGNDHVGGLECKPPSRPLKEYSRGSVDHQMVLRHNASTCFSSTGRRSQYAHAPEAGAGNEADKVVHAELDLGMDPDREVESTVSDEDYDTDLELEDVEKSYDPSGQECYKTACKGFGVVPVSYFLRHMHASELTMMHHGLGPQGTRALAVPLVTNTSILKLNLRDNWMEGTGGVAMAEMLRENCYITGAWHGGSSSPCTRLHLSLFGEH